MIAQSDIFSQALHSGPKESAYIMKVSGFVQLFMVQMTILFFFICVSWVFNLTFDLRMSRI